MRKQFQVQTDQLLKVLHGAQDWHVQITNVVERLEQAFAERKTVFVAGNGGSATLAQHFSDEMVGRYRTARPPLPVIALTADSAVLTCIANDFGFESIFSRQIEALGRAGDVLLVFSTSGDSENLRQAIAQGQKQKLTSIAFTGKRGRLITAADMTVIAPSDEPPRIQELHLHAIHLMCEAFEPESFDT